MTRSLFRENGLFMNVNIYQHILMYSSFIVSGIFDLLSMLFPDISHSIGSNSIEKVCWCLIHFTGFISITFIHDYGIPGPSIYCYFISITFIHDYGIPGHSIYCYFPWNYYISISINNNIIIIPIIIIYCYFNYY